MQDEKLREELFYIARFADECNFKDPKVVDAILGNEQIYEAFSSVFGKRFLTRIIDISRGKEVSDSCIICGKPAKNKVVCKDCSKRILKSDYAKNKIKNKQKNKARSKGIKPLQIIVVVCLIIILFFQLALLHMFNSIPDTNPLEEATVSSYELTRADNEEQALAIVEEEFPASEGWEIRYIGKADCFAGYFILENGVCCDDEAENVSEDEMYDFFWGIQDYRFIVTFKEERTAKMGIVEVNDEGHVIVKGSFNNGRNPEKYYKIK